MECTRDSSTDTPQLKLERVLAATAHRPYPLPPGRWIMRQRWNDLLFAHWPIAPEQMRPLLPRELELDTFDGQAWLAVVPFWMDRVRVRVPFTRDATLVTPTVTRFAELNLRTYVRSPRSGKRGIYFFALECASPLAVIGARIGFHLPYFFASMQFGETAAGIDYRSRRQLSRRSVEVELSYRAAGPVQTPAADGTLAHFLTERYCLFTDAGGKMLCGDIHHEPWSLQPAEAEFRRDELPAAHGLTLHGIAPVLHFSRALQVLIWPLKEDTAEGR